MSAFQRIENIVFGLLMIICALMLILDPEFGYQVVILILSVSLIVRGVRMLVYYLSMAKNMVGGRLILYESIIILDLGMFTLTLSDVPIYIVLLYLIIYNLVLGVIGILGAAESKKQGARFMGTLIQALINIGVAVLCFIFRSSLAAVVGIYAAGLIYFGITRIISAFKRSAIVYVQ